MVIAVFVRRKTFLERRGHLFDKAVLFSYDQKGRQIFSFCKFIPILRAQYDDCSCHSIRIGTACMYNSGRNQLVCYRFPGSWVDNM